MADPLLKRFVKAAAWLVGGLVALCGLIFLVIVQPGGDGVLASLRLPDGSEYMVAQRCNWGVEPYTVAFYMRPPGGSWGWCYVDHEATRWRRVAMAYDPATNSVVVTERGTRQAVLDRNRHVFRLERLDREVDAPQHEPAQLPFAFPG